MAVGSGWTESFTYTLIGTINSICRNSAQNVSFHCTLCGFYDFAEIAFLSSWSLRGSSDQKASGTSVNQTRLSCKRLVRSARQMEASSRAHNSVCRFGGGLSDRKLFGIIESA